MATNRCDGCEREYDFSTYTSMNCVKHKKDYCWECERLGDACPKDGVRCSWAGITNPQWITNLVRGLEKEKNGKES